jgi:glycosyltransferase involved in cell wall biosynthesis
MFPDICAPESSSVRSPHATEASREVASRRPLRVLYFICYPQRLAGANRSLFELVTHLPPEVEPLVVLTDEGAVAAAYREVGVRVIVAPPPAGSPLNAYGKAALAWSPMRVLKVAMADGLAYSWRLRTLMQHERVDLVHVNDSRGALLAGPAARVLRLPLVAHSRGEKPFGGLFWKGFELLPQRVITVCKAIQMDLGPTARRRSIAVYNGIGEVERHGATIPWLEQLRAEGVVAVSCFATLTPFKGQHHLLEAVRILKEQGLAARAVFLCIGDTDPGNTWYGDWLVRRQRELGLDNVTLAGWHPQPWALYRSTDISVLPSVSRERLVADGIAHDVHGNEGFSRSNLEAMSFGLPVIGTDIAGASEQVEHDATGLLVPPADAHALAAALARLILDPAARQRMGEAGRRRVRQLFSTASYVRGVLGVYADLIDSRVWSPPATM